jgi:hypothetical protein
MIIGGVLVAATAGLAVPALATSATPQSPSATCVVVHGPSGFHLQLGYAPNGPRGCTSLP